MLTRVTSQAASIMQHNADMVSHALVWHLAFPCLLAAIGLGLLAIAFEILKVIIRKQIRKLRAKPAKRPF